jgi:hypothetical protein
MSLIYAELYKYYVELKSNKTKLLISTVIYAMIFIALYFILFNEKLDFIESDIIYSYSLYFLSIRIGLSALFPISMLSK